MGGGGRKAVRGGGQRGIKRWRDRELRVRKSAKRYLEEEKEIMGRIVGKRNCQGCRKR